MKKIKTNILSVIGLYVGILVFMSIRSAFAEDKWYSVDDREIRSWDYAPNWRTTMAPPDAWDDVTLNSNKLQPDSPLVITNGVNAVVGTLRLASLDSPSYVTDGRISALRMDGGSLITKKTDWDALCVGYNENGYGNLFLTGGMLSNLWLTVGADGIGVVTNAGGTVLLGDWNTAGLLLGQDKNARGTFVQKSGTIKGRLVIGNNGTGTYIHEGGTRQPTGSVYLGYKATGRGTLEVRGPGFDVRGSTIYVGYDGNGVFEDLFNLKVAYLKIGGGVGTGFVNLYANVTNSIASSFQLGGYSDVDNSTGAVVGKPGFGTYRMTGGTLMFSEGGDTAVNLHIGRYEGGFGVLCGYGMVFPASEGRTNIRMALGKGQVIADGEGVPRDLDLHEVVNVTNVIINSAEDTNGWYAVNKGRVLYPRTWFGTADVTRCLGDVPLAPQPNLVNSLRVTFSGVTGNQNCFLRGGYYAIDREDIPEGLSEDADLIGVWRLGLYSDLSTWNASGNVSFQSASLTFRYDHTRIKNRRSLILFRYNGKVWTRVGGGIVTAEHRISTNQDLSPLPGEDANIGWFAIVAPQEGSMIFLH